MLQRVEFTKENLQRWADCNQPGDEQSMSPEGWKIRVLDFAEAKMQAPRLARTLLEAQQTIDNLTKENQRLEAKVEYQYDELARIQGFYKCLRELPEVCDYQTAIFLYLQFAISHKNAMKFWEIGVELQRVHGYEKVEAKTQVEIGQGVWHTIREALKGE
jgi:hypothetical protein